MSRVRVKCRAPCHITEPHSFTAMQSYVKDGYIIIPSLLSPIIQQSLLDAAERVVAKARTAEWPHRRTVGSQFPPYDRQQDTEADVWGVQHVMHPDLDELEFLEWYTSTGIRDVACKLMGCEEGDLQMGTSTPIFSTKYMLTREAELFNLLVNPEHTPFALRWHRDDVRSTATLSEEIDALSKRQYGIQWNTALLDDACLFVVPGTHATPLTDEQRSVLNSPWNEPDREGFDPMKMPGAKRVELRGAFSHRSTCDLHPVFLQLAKRSYITKIFSIARFTLPPRNGSPCTHVWVTFSVANIARGIYSSTDSDGSQVMSLSIEWRASPRSNETK